MCVPEAVVANFFRCWITANVGLNLFVSHADIGWLVVLLCESPQVTYTLWLGELKLATSLAHSGHTAAMLAKLPFKIPMIYAHVVEFKRQILVPGIGLC